MSDDRRTSFRCPVGADLGDGILHCARGRFPVTVVEQSAGGFGLKSAEPVSVREGQSAVLHSKQGTFETIVVHNSAGDDGNRIGLRRLAEVTITPAGRIKHSTGRSAPRFPIGILALCVAFFGSGVAVPMLVGNDRDVIQLPSSATAPSVRLTKSVMLLQDLKSSSFVQDLKLDESQRHKIALAVDEAVFNLNALFQNRAKLSEDERAIVGLQLLSGAWQDIQDTLTADQRQRWDQLASGKPAS